MAKQITRYNFLVTFFVALGSFTYGFNASIMGTVLGLPSFYSYFNLGKIGAGSSYQSSIIGATNGVFCAGGVIGCCLVSWPADKIGRRRTVQIICLICIISSILQAAAVNIAMLLVGRVLNGIGSGMMDVIVPLYQSEIAPRKTRGQLVGSHGFLVVTGYAIAAWTGVGCYFESNPQIQWRLCLALQMVGPILLVLGSPRIPESPRWLLTYNRRSEALKILTALHSSEQDAASGMSAQEECSAIERQLRYDLAHHKGLISSLRDPSCRKRFFIGFFVQAVAQSTGVLVINNYQVILYTGLGLSGYLPLLLYAVYTSWAAFLNWAGSMIVDRAGRVRMLSIGCGGCALMVACEAAMVAVYGGTGNKIGNGFGVFFLFAFVTFYGSCVDAISYIYCSEIFPTRLRAQGMGFSIVALFLMTLVYTQPAPTAFAQVGWKYYLVFMFTPLLGSLVMLLKFPETKGLTLEEIEAMFGDVPSTDNVDDATQQEEHQQANSSDLELAEPTKAE